MSSDEIDVRIADEAESSQVIDVLQLAFCKDPTFRWMFPTATAYLKHFAGFVSNFGGRAFANKTAHIAGDFSGAATWLPPGVHADGDALERTIHETTPKEQLPDLMAVLEEMGACHPEEPHWYLAIIGVDPARQGQGIGSLLLDYALAGCDRDGLPAYLESSNPANVPLYERHGFVVQGEIQHGESPIIYPMYRDAR